MTALCTISTQSHVVQSVALLQSSARYADGTKGYILIVDDVPDMEQYKMCYPEWHFLTIEELMSNSDVAKVVEKYGADSDKVRWTLKPFLMKFLIQQLDYAKVIYADNDICFFNNYSFLEQYLDESDILLFPHWRIAHPSIDQQWFETNFKDGIFNAGFLAVNSSALPFLEWWGDCCLHKCEKDHVNGYHDDQRYLDIVPVLFERVKIVSHKGCNIAYWNVGTLRKQVVEGQLKIDGTYEVVFVHFTSDYIGLIPEGDTLMLPYYSIYLQELKIVRERIANR